MPATNAPRIFATASGNVSVETEIVDSQRRQRQIPIVDVPVTVLAGTVKSPNILFKFALEEGMLLLLILWVYQQNLKQILCDC